MYCWVAGISNTARVQKQMYQIHLSPPPSRQRLWPKATIHLLFPHTCISRITPQTANNQKEPKLPPRAKYCSSLHHPPLCRSRARCGQSSRRGVQSLALHLRPQGPQCFPPSADETEVDLTVEPGVHKYSLPHSSPGIEGKHFALPAVLGECWRSGLTRPGVACSSFDVASTAIGIGVGVV